MTRNQRMVSQDNTPPAMLASASAPEPAQAAGIPGDQAKSALLARNWWALALRGLAAVLFGLIAFIVPTKVMLSLALIFAAYLFIDGVFGIIAAVRAAGRGQRWGLLVAEGILNMVMGLVAALFPAGAVLAFVLVTAVWALATGGLMLASAILLKTQHGRGWLAAGGAVSMLWGVLLLIAPMASAVALTWWLGAYAITFGVVLIALSLKLRRQRDGGADVARMNRAA
jgi:uncharacterized membrane protein HdeD (DUF308 family)